MNQSGDALKNTIHNTCYPYFLAVLVSLTMFPAALRGGALDYGSAAKRLMKNSLPLHISAMEVDAVRATHWQAERYPNPVATFGCCSDRTEFALSQLIPLGGKRRAFAKTIASQASVAAWDYHILQQNLLHELAKGFIDVAAKQETLKLAQDQCILAEKSQECVAAKKSGGKSSLIEHKKTEISACTCRLAVRKAQRDFDAAKHELARLLGDPQPDFDVVDFSIFSVQPPLDLSSLRPLIELTPEMGKAAAEWASFDAIYHFERAKRFADIEITGGVETSYHMRCKSFIFEIEAPLQIFDHNEGNISRALLERERAACACEELKRNLNAKLHRLHGESRHAFEELNTLGDLAATTAKENFEAAQAGYREGKYEYLELLEAQRTLFDVQSSWIEAAAEYQLKQAEIARLIAQFNVDDDYAN